MFQFIPKVLIGLLFRALLRSLDFFQNIALCKWTLLCAKFGLLFLVKVNHNATAYLGILSNSVLLTMGRTNLGKANKMVRCSAVRKPL